MDVSLIHKPDIRFVDQGGGLESVTLPLAAHVAAGETVQFVVDKGIQLVERGLIAIAPVGEQLSNLMLLRWFFQ